MYALAALPSPNPIMAITAVALTTDRDKIGVIN